MTKKERGLGFRTLYGVINKEPVKEEDISDGTTRMCYSLILQLVV